jgi:hypothetical protein
MKEQYLLVLPKSSIGKALGYSIQRWDQLMIYAGDGKLNIDNYHNFYNMRTAA